MRETDIIVRARAPLRLGLAGGGTDLSPYCDLHGGAVLNSTIARYAHASIAPSPDGKLRFIARDIDLEEVFPADHEAVASANLAIHAGVWRRVIDEFGGGIPRAWTITTHVDAPPGSGLGSSSALAVALVEAFRTRLSLPLGLYDVAHLAYEIERIDLGLSGGKQDQYAAAFGGTNFMEFLAAGRVIVNPLRVPRGNMNELESALVTCFTGVSRRSEQIIQEQQRGMASPDGSAMDSLHQLKQDAIDMKQALLRGQIGGLAEILNRSWIAKQRTASGITTELIDQLFTTAMAAGATAGKVSGAGGGGFIMFLVPPDRRVRLIRALNDAGAGATSSATVRLDPASPATRSVTAGLAFLVAGTGGPLVAANPQASGFLVTGTPARSTICSMPRWKGSICPFRVNRPSGNINTARPAARAMAIFSSEPVKLCGFTMSRLSM